MFGFLLKHKCCCCKSHFVRLATSNTHTNTHPTFSQQGVPTHITSPQIRTSQILTFMGWAQVVKHLMSGGQIGQVFKNSASQASPRPPGLECVPLMGLGYTLSRRGTLSARQERANRSQMLQLETGQSPYTWENLKEFWKSHKS